LAEFLPYVSGAAAIGAAWGAARGVPWQRAARVVALATLAVAAFMRGSAPSALSAGLLLSALAQGVPSPWRPRWATGSALAAAAAWLVFAYLFAHAGLGASMVRDPMNLAAAVAVLVVGAAATWRLNRTGRLDVGSAVEAAALVLMLLAATALPLAGWIALAGAVAVAAAEVVAISSSTEEGAEARGSRPVGYWLLLLFGQVAVAWVFLR
jgi:uncharacterized membrane protein YhhN